MALQPTPAYPAPILGKPGIQTSEFFTALAAFATVVCSLIFHKDLGNDITLVGDSAAALVSLGYGLSRAITKTGVVNALAAQHIALSAAGTEVVRTVETVDPEIAPKVNQVEGRVSGLETSLNGLTPALAAVASLDPRLKVVEDWIARFATPASAPAQA